MSLTRRTILAAAAAVAATTAAPRIFAQNRAKEELAHFGRAADYSFSIRSGRALD